MTVPRAGIRSRARLHVQQRALNLLALDAAITRAPRRRGLRTLRAILEDYRDPPNLRSKFERDFYALIKRSGLPQPQTFSCVATGCSGSPTSACVTIPLGCYPS